MDRDGGGGRSNEPTAPQTQRLPTTAFADSSSGARAISKTLRRKAAVNLRDFCQAWIPTGQQSGLQMRTATLASVSLCVRMKS
jgi:hypothetical protein